MEVSSDLPEVEAGAAGASEEGAKPVKPKRVRKRKAKPVAEAVAVAVEGI